MKSIFIRIALISFLLVIFIPHSAFAKMKTFIKEYTYRASEADSKLSSRTTATAEVKRLLLEELGTYLESITEVKNFQLAKDQITALTAGIVKTEIIDEKWNGETYWIKTKMVADSDDVIKSIDVLRKDRNKLQELEDTKRKADVLLEENKKLREELAHAKGNAKLEVQQRYDRSIKKLSAIEWFESAWRNYNNGDNETAVRHYTKALELNPNYADVYLNRGSAYYFLGKYDEAIADYNKAIELNPNAAYAYSARAFAYYILGKYYEAIVAYNKAIELNPNAADAYLNRGSAYYNLGKYHEAFADYSKAIALNPNDADAYNGRGLAYNSLGKHDEAIADFKKARELKANK